MRVRLAAGETRAQSLGEDAASLCFLALKSQAEVAMELGISRQRVTLLERGALLKIRKWYRQQVAVSGASVHAERRMAILERYHRQIVRWRRLIRKMILSNRCHEEARMLIFAVAECEASLKRAMVELRVDDYS